jgi:hypothetical protein
MTWVLKEEILVELSANPERKAWTEEKAYDAFHEIWEKLKPEHREKTRIGTLGFQPMVGSESLEAWMFPIEGHPKILGYKNTVQLIDREGMILFEGTWGETPLDLIKEQVDIFIWLPYRHGSTPEKLDWKTRLLGVFRYFKNRHRGKKP